MKVKDVNDNDFIFAISSVERNVGARTDQDTPVVTKHANLLSTSLTSCGGTFNVQRLEIMDVIEPTTERDPVNIAYSPRGTFSVVVINTMRSGLGV